MAKCIFDEFDECTYDCMDCRHADISCSECGCKDGAFFEICGRTFCFECFREEIEAEEFENFAAEFETEFSDFLMKKHDSQRVRVSRL